MKYCFPPFKPLAALASAATLFALASAAHAQLTQTDPVYSDNFSGDGLNTELTAGQTTTGGASSTGWVTNDPDNLTVGAQAPPANVGYVSGLGAYLGGGNDVAFFGAFTDGKGAAIGGTTVGNFSTADPADPDGNFTALPTVQTSFVDHPFTLPATSTGYTFAVDSTITTSSTAINANAGATDSFSYTFRNASGGTLFSINFNFDATATANSGKPTDVITYSLGGSATQIASTNGQAAGILLNGRYHFVISVNSVNNTFSLSDTASGITSTPFVNASLVPTGSLTPAITAGSVNQVDVGWTLSNTTTTTTPQTATGKTGTVTAYTNPGSNYLAFDNYTVTSQDLVPEPSTYAMMGAGLLGLLGIMKFRRRA